MFLKTIMRNDFAVFILSHGRADNVITVSSLEKSGYTGMVFIVVDDEDQTINEYKARYGNQVIVFDKKAMADETDEGDNFDLRRTTTHVRNAIFKIAKEKGIKYFIQLDDDYTIFIYKFDDQNEYKQRRILSIDRVFDLLIDYLERTKANSVAMAQNGDFIGGGQSGFAKNLKPRRKCMNTFVCDSERPFKFVGRLNEDVNTYVTLGGKGNLFFTIPNIAINQTQTQKTKGGMTEAYLEGGTYVKSFYTVMMAPSCVKVGMMGDKHKRLHHKIRWKNAVPVILSEEVKKK